MAYVDTHVDPAIVNVGNVCHKIHPKMTQTSFFPVRESCLLLLCNTPAASLVFVLSSHCRDCCSSCQECQSVALIGSVDLPTSLKFLASAGIAEGLFMKAAEYKRKITYMSATFLVLQGVGNLILTR